MEKAWAMEVMTTPVEVPATVEVMTAAMTVSMTMTVSTTSVGGCGQCNRGYGDRCES